MSAFWTSRLKHNQEKEIMDNLILNRFKSFGWRLASAIVVFGLSWIIDNIGLLELPIWLQGIITLALGEITKWWNSKMALKGKNFFGQKID